MFFKIFAVAWSDLGLGDVVSSSPEEVVVPKESACKITSLPHEAVAEVSKHKEPIGRRCVEFNWFKSQLMSDSNALRIK